MTPVIAHLVFIPGVLLVGVWIGAWLGARSARAELERRQQKRRQ